MTARGRRTGSDRIAARVAGANKIYEPAGFALVSDPADRIDVRNTVLAEDTTRGDPERNVIARSNLAAQHSGHMTIFFRDWKVDFNGVRLPTMVAYGFSGDPRFGALGGRLAGT